MIITFRLSGQLLELLSSEGKRKRSRVIRDALKAYYRKLGLWRDTNDTA